MRGLMSAWVDGALSGLARRFVEWHLGGCERCREALPILRALRTRLRGLKAEGDAPPPSLSPERWAAVEASWEQADHGSE